MGIDPAKCGQDLAQAESPQFAVCESLVESSLTDIAHFFDYTNATATQFCQSACPSKVITLLKKIETDCGIDPTELVSRWVFIIQLVLLNFYVNLGPLYGSVLGQSDPFLTRLSRYR